MLGELRSMSNRWSSETWGDDCATGVCFTRDPSSGEKKFFGEYLINAQGEDVVAGIRTPPLLMKHQKMLRIRV